MSTTEINTVQVGLISRCKESMKHERVGVGDHKLEVSMRASRNLSSHLFAVIIVKVF